MIPPEQFGVISKRPSDGASRIEIRFFSEKEGFRPVCLGAGNFAQVFDGQLRVGRFSLPLAVKVQRTLALNREAHRAVEAKFDAEKATHDRLMADRPSKEEYPIVEQIEWGTSGEQSPLKLAPSILCPHAKHALVPRCPHCKAVLAEDPWTADQNERALVCTECAARFGESEENKTRIRSATVRLDPACEGCVESDAVCRRSADFFNFFPSRVLLFDRQELDLDTYLKQSALVWEHRQPVGFWKRRSRSESLHADLEERLDLLTQALNGIRYLHNREIAHLDLKPANFCLRIDAGRVRVSVIDLGLVSDSKTVEYLQQAGGQMHLTGAFAPPEMKEPAKKYLGTFSPSKPLGKFVLAQAPIDASWNPAILAGDEVELRVDGNYAGHGRIQNVLDDGKQLVIGWISPPEVTREQEGEIVVHKQRGQAADLYSFGMLILSVLTNEAEPNAYQESLGQWSKAIAELPDKGRSATELWGRLKKEEVFSRLDKDLDRYGPGRLYAEEAVQIALTLVCRSADGRCVGHMSDRGQAAEPVLADLNQRWATLTASFQDASRLRSAEEIRRRMKDLLPSLETRLSKGFAKKGGKSGATSASLPPQPLVIEKAILEFANNTDEVTREQGLQSLQDRYAHHPDKLFSDLHRYIDPEPDGISRRPSPGVRTEHAIESITWHLERKKSSWWKWWNRTEIIEIVIRGEHGFKYVDGFILSGCVGRCPDTPEEGTFRDAWNLVSDGTSVIRRKIPEWKSSFGGLVFCRLFALPADTARITHPPAVKCIL